jgi:predicted transcriptional regulator
VRVHIYVSAELLRRLDAIRSDRPRSLVIRRALEAYVKREEAKR